MTNDDAVWSGTTSALAKLRQRFHAHLGLAVGGVSVDASESNELASRWPWRRATALPWWSCCIPVTRPFEAAGREVVLNMLRLELLKEDAGPLNAN